MKIIRRGEGRQIGWKNGKGRATILAQHPPGAEPDQEQWRISIAEAGDNAPYADYPGFDRTVLVVEGAGVMLDFGGGTVALGPRSAPLCFPGEAPVTGWLIDGPSNVLNVMTRRGQLCHRVVTLRVANGTQLPAGCTAVICRDGIVSLGGETLGASDLALIDRDEMALMAAGAGMIAAICITDMDHPAVDGDDPVCTQDPAVQIDAPPTT